MDAQFWIYIIIGVIYFLSKLLKKPEQEPGETPQGGERRQGQAAAPTAGDRPKPLTFEELLREITEGKQPEKPELRPAPQPQRPRYEQEFKEEAQSLEEVRYDERNDEEVFKAYERAKSQVFERASLEETLLLKKTDMDFGKFKAFKNEEKKRLSDDYMKIFRSPEGLKQAVVMSEILKRKF